MKLPKLKIYRKLLIGLILSVVFTIVGVATAQEVQRTFTVVNPAIVQNLNPGDTAEGTTKVINDSTVPLTFSVGVQDYIVVDGKGTPNILPPNTLNNKYSAASWIGVTPSTFTIKPGEKQTLNYYIQIPRDAKPGGHYAALVYQPKVDATANATGGVVNTQIGSLFYVTVKGPIKEDASIVKFFANSFQEYGPVKILTQIKNNGDLHITPKGSIILTGLFKNSTYIFNDQKQSSVPVGNIFPETLRDFENSVGSNLMIGRYKAVLLANYGVNNNLPLTATLYFWVFPWRLALVIILAVLAIILGYMYWKKRKKDNSKATKEPKNEVVEKVEEKTTTPPASKKVG
jgi:hypothetical protein